MKKFFGYVGLVGLVIWILVAVKILPLMWEGIKILIVSHSVPALTDFIVIYAIFGIWAVIGFGFNWLVEKAWPEATHRLEKVRARMRQERLSCFNKPKA